MHSSELDSITWKLLTPTKNLETAFKAWSRGEASEADVSDHYVRLGNDFIAARSRLAHGGVPTDDLIDVPTRLRTILEEALALDCSPEVAERFDPQIRGIMTQLFHQLKAKQLQLTANSPHPQGAQGASLNSRHSSQSSASQIPGTKAQTHPQAPRPAQYTRMRPTHPQQHSQHQNNAGLSKPHGFSQSPRISVNGPTNSNHDPQDSLVHNHLRPPPIPAPKPPQGIDEDEEDALSLLQRHGALERQASKRYSTRQISRMINGSASEQISLPTTGIHKTFNTPEYSDSNVFKESKPKPEVRVDMDSTPPETPEQSIRRKSSISNRCSRSASLQKGVIDERKSPSNTSTTSTPQPTVEVTSQHNTPIPSIKSRRSVSANAVTNFIPSSPGKSNVSDDFVVFLRLGNSVRKAMLTKPPSIAAIRLRFVEVCAYIHSGNETFPEILIQHPQSGINYELTEATVGDVNEGSLLTLKVKTQQEIDMQEELKEIKNTMKEMVTKMSQISTPTPRRSVSKQGYGIVANSPYAGSNPSNFPSPVLTGDGRFKLEKPPPPPREISVDKVEAVHRELAVIRQLSNKTISSLRSEVQKLKKEVTDLNSAPVTNTISDRRSMNLIKEKMEADSQELLSQMENLSDIIDAQRVGIGSHDVRYPQNELEKVRRQLSAWSSEFQKSEEFIENEKPVWKKTWQAELNNVIEDQEWLKSLDLLYADLRSDLEQSVKTFELVCEANSLPRNPGLKQGIPIAPPIKPGEEQAVADAVFHEITALNLNHEQRAEAVQRAERLHRARLALRSEEFEDELNTFVSDAKLKPNGGYEEVERRLREREELARKLGEESEAEARKVREIQRKERKLKRQADNNSESWHDPPSEPNDNSQQEKKLDNAQKNEPKDT